MNNNLPLPSDPDPDGYYRGILVGGGGPLKGEALQTELDDTRRRLGEWQQRANDYEQENAELRTERTELRRQHAADIKRIGERILSETEDAEYEAELWDGVIADLNTKLHIHLPVRQYTYVATFSVRVEYKVEVEATDDDDAESTALDGFDRQGIIDALRHTTTPTDIVTCTVERKGS
jgi:hypothetical protein